MPRSIAMMFAVALGCVSACRHTAATTDSEAKGSESLPVDASPIVISAALDAAPPVDSPPSDAKSPALPEAFRIVDVRPDGSGTMITINKGRDDGVDETWHGHLIDSVGQRVSGGDLTLAGVAQRTTRARVALPYDVVKKYRAVKMDWH